MTVPKDLINLALFDAGVIGTNQVASAQDINLGFTRLNYMLSEWQRERWLVYHTIDLSVVANGNVSYSIGPGGDIDISARPDRIEGGFFRQLVTSNPNQIDYPMDILESRTDYNNIAIKQLTSFPMYCFYDPDFPLGYLYPWPLPNASIYEMHVTIKMLLNQFNTLTDNFNLPLEYENAIHWNLVRRFIAAYQIPVDSDQRNEIKKLARDALNTLRKANSQIGRLELPLNLVRPGIYDPYSDQVR